MQDLHFFWASSIVLVALASACGSDETGSSGAGATSGAGASGASSTAASTGGGGPTGSGGTGASGGGGAGAAGAAGGAGGSGAGGGTGGTGGAACVNLTVKNYLSWCSVGVNNGAPSSAATQTVCVPPGTIDLAASALVGFQLGAKPWHDTDGDQGSGDPGTVTGSGQSAISSTTVTVVGTDCAWVCCEFTNGGGCPTTDQCP